MFALIWILGYCGLLLVLFGGLDLLVLCGGLGVWVSCL